jgi:hypothetical protein
MDSKVKHLTLILGEVDKEEDQRSSGRTVYKHISISAKLRTGRRGQETGLREVH